MPEMYLYTIRTETRGVTTFYAYSHRYDEPSKCWFFFAGNDCGQIISSHELQSFIWNRSDITA